jgi:dihydroorotate dehydrogenase (fumarate)
MNDLTVHYAGLFLKNPLIAGASGFTSSIDRLIELEKNGIAAVVLKSIFEEEIINEFNESLASDDQFQSNREFLDYYDYELKQENVNRTIKLIKDAKQKLSIPVIASINCVSSGEWIQFAKKFQEAGADALELNIFLLPSDASKTGAAIEHEYFKIIRTVKDKISIPVTVKMSPFFTNISEMIQKTAELGVAGIVLFNRSYNPDFDIEKMQITSSNVFSKPEDYTLPLRFIAINSGKVSCSLAASTGIHDGNGLIKLLLAGADAVQIASTLYVNGNDQINTMLKELEVWMKSKNYLSVSAFKGKLAVEKAKNPAEFERVQFMKHFSDREI